LANSIAAMFAQENHVNVEEEPSVSSENSWGTNQYDREGIDAWKLSNFTVCIPP
jgi:hypothetical protein